MEEREVSFYHNVKALTSSAYMPPLLSAEVRVAGIALARPDSKSSSGHGRGRFGNSVRGAKLDNCSLL